MACSLQPNGRKQKPAHLREMDNIVHALASGSENALTQLNSLTEHFDALYTRASVTLTRYAATHGQFISSKEARVICDGLERALTEFKKAKTEINTSLRDAEKEARRCLWPGYTGRQTLERLIANGRENNLLRTVAYTRVGLAPPPSRVPMLGWTVSTVARLTRIVSIWGAAASNLDFHMKIAMDILTDLLTRLSQIRLRTGNVVNLAMQEVNHIFNAVRGIFVETNDTLLVTFRQTSSEMNRILSGIAEATANADFPLA